MHRPDIRDATAVPMQNTSIDLNKHHVYFHRRPRVLRLIRTPTLRAVQEKGVAKIMCTEMPTRTETGNVF